MPFTANTEEIKDVMIGVTNETLDSYRYINKYKQGMKDLANRLNNVRSDLKSELEITPDFLNGRLQEGSYGEMWSVRKMLRRFIWHDRIHAKAMWRMATKTFNGGEVENIFRF